MDDNTVHYGTGASEAWWRRLTKRTVLIPAFALLFIGVGAWVIVNMQSKSNKKETALDSAIKASDAAFQTGDYSKSLEQLQGAADQAESKDDKIVLYANLAAAAASAGEMDKAIDYLNQKHKIAPETGGQDAYLLGSYYERIEDNAKAIDQYKKAITYLKSTGDAQSNQNKIYSLEVRIESLGG